MTKLILIALTLMTGVITVCGQDKMNDTTSIKLGKILDEFKNKNRCPGVSLAIVHENEIVYSLSLGYTDLENKTAVTADAKFPVMSITKTFTATMLMQLKEKGIVRLDDELNKYIPEYPIHATTLLQLATHNSGLPRNSPADMDFTTSFDTWMLSGGKKKIKAFATKAALLESLSDMQLQYPPYDYIHPNDRHYSNLGYELLGIALERAAKEEYTAYVRRHIFQPLGMTHSGFLNEGGILIVKGYRYNTTTGIQDAVPSFDINGAIYAGGMYSTAADLCKFIAYQWTGENNAMMRQLKIAWKPAFPYVLHEGALPGYRSIIVFNPSTKAGWVILSNGNDVDFNAINGSLAEVVGGMFNKRTKPDLAEFAGTYSLPGKYGHLTISQRGDSLYSDYLQESVMVREGDRRWKVTGANGYSIGYEFTTGDDGKINALNMGQFVWYKH